MEPNHITSLANFTIGFVLMQEEVPKPEQEAAVEDQEDNGSFHSPQKSDESDDDDFQRWCQYKSDY